MINAVLDEEFCTLLHREDAWSNFMFIVLFQLSLFWFVITLVGMFQSPVAVSLPMLQHAWQTT